MQQTIEQLNSEAQVERTPTPRQQCCILNAGPCPPHEAPPSIYAGCEFYDDVSGVKLDHAMTVAARKLEIEFCRNRGVYTKIKREPWMHVITTKWLDVNKGDADEPSVRCRLVGREIAKVKRDDFFAATPPLECLKMVIDLCTSQQTGSSPSRRTAI